MARRLALRVDAVAENFAPGAMAKWKLDYASLVVERPDLVMISTCLNGQTGPQRFYPGFGGQGSALSGFNHLTGWPDRAPVGPYGTITDSLSPRFAALLLASALLHRQRTGHGQHIDLAQVEGGIVCLSESIATFTGNGEILGRLGNRSRHEAPHGVFRCADEDGRERWIAIVVHDDTDWQRLVQALGRPAWALDPQLATTAGRLAAVDALEARIQEWTSSQSAVRARRHPPGRRHRGGRRSPISRTCTTTRRSRTAATSGTSTIPSSARIRRRRHAIRFSDMEPRLRSPAPRLGEHTDAVLRDLLGMSTDEIGRLRDAGVLE